MWTQVETAIELFFCKKFRCLKIWIPLYQKIWFPQVTRRCQTASQFRVPRITSTSSSDQRATTWGRSSSLPPSTTAPVERSMPGASGFTPTPCFPHFQWCYNVLSKCNANLLKCEKQNHVSSSTFSLYPLSCCVNLHKRFVFSILLHIPTTIKENTHYS